MSKPVKNLIAESYKRRFGQLDGAVVIDICGVKSNDVNRLRGDLGTKSDPRDGGEKHADEESVAGTSMEGHQRDAQRPASLVYGGESVVNVARQLIDLAKEIENLEFKGALMEGQVLARSDHRAEQVSHA